VDRDFGPDLELAHEVADAADAITAPAFEARAFTVSRKADRSEVSEIDRDTESEIVRRLRAARPVDAVFGEEHGVTGPTDAEWTWVIDPIDGTSNYVRGLPVWATLVALVHRVDGPVLGLVSAPSMNRRWWGVRGGGARANGRPIAVSKIDSVHRAQVSVVPNRGWRDLGVDRALADLQFDAARARGFGDFWQHMLVAEGAIDVAIDAVGLAPYDIAALVPVVEEAGGRLTDRVGRRDHLSNTAITTNGLLHDEIVNRLRPPVG